MREYELFYKKISNKYRNNKNLTSLKLQIKIAPLIYALLYIFSIFYLVYKKEDNILILKYIGVPLISFIFVSIFRKLYNSKRPYELHNIDPLIVKNKKGQSMPSRHVFSASLIATCFYIINPVISTILLIYTVKMAYDRVISGIHFPKDVIIGYMLGIISGVIFFIL